MNEWTNERRKKSNSSGSDGNDNKNNNEKCMQRQHSETVFVCVRVCDGIKSLQTWEMNGISLSFAAFFYSLTLEVFWSVRLFVFVFTGFPFPSLACALFYFSFSLSLGVCVF